MSEPNVLSLGWVYAPLEQLADVIGGVTKGRDLAGRPTATLPYLRVANVQRGFLDLEVIKTIEVLQGEVERYLLQPGDVLLTEGGDADKLGRAAIWQDQIERCIHQNHIFRARPVSCHVLPQWLAYYANSEQGRAYFLNAAKQTVNLASINLTQLRNCPIPLAPLAEQRRIVAAIEQHFTRLDAGVAALRRAQTALKRYRAAVLKSAVEGALTASWRAHHPIPAPHAAPSHPLASQSAQADFAAIGHPGANSFAGPSPSGRLAGNAPIEPASALLARILAERRARWEADLRAKGKDPAKTRYAEPTAPDTATLPSLPDGWCWATMEQVGEVQLGRQRAPQHHVGPYMRPYLRVANVFEDRIDTSDVLSMNFTPDEFETYRLRYGDILLNEGQSLELVGRPAMYRDEVPGACFQNTLVRFRASDNLRSAFALIVFRAYLHNKRFQRIGKHTVNIAHLGAQRFAELEFPLPPLAEQEQIVAEVERRLSVVTELEAAVAANLKRAERLRQSILREAFAGRLVPQDPTDEPASALLERIQREQEQHAGKSVNGRKQESIPVRQEALWHD